MNDAAAWRTTSGDSWARRWRETDRALGELAPQLLDAILEAAPSAPFRAFEVGCGAGSMCLALASERRDAIIAGCDLSPALVEVARQRLAGEPNVRVVPGDATEVAPAEGPFELVFSRHGLMFFAEPVRAFRALRSAAAPGAALVFSCFQDWSANRWASQLACAAAGRPLAPPGREPSGFALSDPDYVRSILEASRWCDAEVRPAPFRYVVGEGPDALDEALSFLGEIGPASSAVRALPEEQRAAAVERMRAVLESRNDGSAIAFPAAAWIWSARAGAA